MVYSAQRAFSGEVRYRSGNGSGAFYAQIMSDFCGLLVMTDREGKSTGYKHSLLLWQEKSLSESAQLNKEKGFFPEGDSMWEGKYGGLIYLLMRLKTNK